jgi:hypothetical protein
VTQIRSGATQQESVPREPRSSPWFSLLAALALPLGALAQEIRLGNEFRVDTHTTERQYRASVATDADGDFVDAWSSEYQEGSALGVFARGFADPVTLDIDGDGTVGPLTDGLLVLRHLLGFTGVTLTSGAVNTNGCNRCSAAAIEPYLLSLPPAAEAQAVRLGSEFQVSTYTTSYQYRPSVAANAAGDFVVAWSSYGQDGSGDGLFARRFSSAGAPLATEFQVNTRTIDNQYESSVAASPAGDFVVAWQSRAPQDGSDSGVFARSFSSVGAALATEFQVNAHTASSQRYPSVAVDADGDFVVAWLSYGQDGPDDTVLARRFSSAGAALATEFQVNTHTASYQYSPSLAASADGDFVVAWGSYRQDGSSGVFARRFSSAGAALAAEFQVNTHTTSGQGSPSVAANAAGDFVVAWGSQSEDGSYAAVFARRFSSAGAPLATEFQVNTYTASGQVFPSAANAGGDFVVAWGTLGQDGSNLGVFARRFSSAGVPLATEFQVNAYTTLDQSMPSVAADADGDFVVAWNSDGQDSSSFGAFAQRFAVPDLLDIDGDGTPAALTDGLLVLRYLFGFTGATLTSGVVNTNGCTRCDAAAIEPYLQTLI